MNETDTGLCEARVISSQVLQGRQLELIDDLQETCACHLDFNLHYNYDLSPGGARGL